MTGIPYLDEVWNPITGCSGRGCKVHTAHPCWTEIMVKRFPAIHDQWTQDRNFGELPFSSVQFHPDRLDKPLDWRKPRRIGVCFMGDLFDEQVDFRWVHQIWDIMKQCLQHQFFILTKQSFRMLDMVDLIYRKEAMGHAKGFWSHVYLGVSITDQEDADRMIPDLLRIPGKKWLSLEPMLGAINLSPKADFAYRFLSPYYDKEGKFDHTASQPAQDRREHLFPKIDWVVLGCESGPKRRPCPQAWMINVVRQCDAAGVKCYVKQIDMGKRISHDPAEWPEELRRQELP